MAAVSGGAAAMIRALKASGVLVTVPPEEFGGIIARAESPLVVVAPGGWFHARYRYITSYKGLAFYAESDNPIQIPAGAEVVQAGRIWMPA